MPLCMKEQSIHIVKFECGGLTSGRVESPLSVDVCAALEIQTQSLQNY